MRPAFSSWGRHAFALAILWVGRPALAAPPAAPPAAPAAPGAAAPAADEPPMIAVKFGKQCGSCHTLGDGDRTGPDLLGVLQRRDKKWITTFVRGPGAAIDGGDPIANQLLGKFKGVRMPDQALTDQELTELFAYFEDCTAKKGCKITLGKIKHASEATPADVAAGARLFDGRTALAAGGPPCISCHNVRGAGLLGGGTLAKDLTFAYARLGDAGISSALAATPFKLMKTIFPKHPLSNTEAFQIKAYLAGAAKDGTPPAADPNFVYLGIIGLIGALGAIGLIWRGRMRGVREEMVGKSTVRR